VDIPIPEGGLGRRLDEMHAWHLARGLQAQMGSAGLWKARFYFRDETTAAAFRAKFVSTFAIPPMPENDPIAMIEWARRYIQD
jgi:hypothetical protein